MWCHCGFISSLHLLAWKKGFSFVVEVTVVHLSWVKVVHKLVLKEVNFFGASLIGFLNVVSLDTCWWSCIYISLFSVLVKLSLATSFKILMEKIVLMPFVVFCWSQEWASTTLKRFYCAWLGPFFYQSIVCRSTLWFRWQRGSSLQLSKKSMFLEGAHPLIW
jgi:hypothetical protein